MEIYFGRYFSLRIFPYPFCPFKFPTNARSLYFMFYYIYIYYIHFHVLCTMRIFLSIQIVHKSRSSINVPISRKYPLVDRLRKRRRLVKIHSIRSLSNNYYACHLFRTKYNISSNVHFTFVHLPD